MERWATVTEFPNYEVSDYGRVRNKDTGYILSTHQNQSGVVMAGFQFNCQQRRRSVPLLVALAFLDPPPNAAYTTPVNLNGDRTDNHAANLVWRPRWFAIKYNKQFHEEIPGSDRPVRNVKTGEEFHTLWDPAIQDGLLVRDIKLSIHNRTYVFPTFQQFELIE